MADEKETRLNEGLDKWLQVTDTDKLETWDGTDKMAALKESLGINDNVAISDIVDDLNSTSVTKPLSANQGKVLQDGKEDADNTILKEDDVEDSLNSTSTTKPLSANQGKELNDDKASLSALGDAAFEGYEEGTWTPKIGIAGVDAIQDPPGAGTEGLYVKIGKKVICSCRMDASGIDFQGATGSFTLNGLPYLSAATSVTFGVHFAGLVTDSRIFSTLHPSNLELRFNRDFCHFTSYSQSSGRESLNTSNSSVGSGGNLIAQISYIAQ